MFFLHNEFLCFFHIVGKDNQISKLKRKIYQKLLSANFFGKPSEATYVIEVGGVTIKLKYSMEGSAFAFKQMKNMKIRMPQVQSQACFMDTVLLCRWYSNWIEFNKRLDDDVKKKGIKKQLQYPGCPLCYGQKNHMLCELCFFAGLMKFMIKKARHSEKFHHQKQQHSNW